MSELDEIKQKLDLYSDLYYNHDTSLISDAEFDRMKELYEELSENKYDSVGVIPGDNRLEKVERSIPMLSLDKIKDDTGVQKWFKNKFKNEAYIMPKLDGVSLELKYCHGVLSQAVTRGNGYIGEDVTHNALRIDSIPNFCRSFIKYDVIYVRGEVLIKKDNFAKIQIDSNDFVSARNLVSGTIRLKDSSKIKERYPDFIAYELFKTNRYNYHFEKQLLLLKKAKFNVIDNKFIFISDDRDIKKLMKIINKYDHKKYEYQIDGFVLRLNDRKVCRNLGEGNYSPKWSFAYKLGNATNNTVIKDIKWQVSHTGRVNPVAILDPVEILGVKIKQASLHNLQYIKDLGLRKNCIVVVERANDVIPYISKAFDDGDGEFEIPDKCPSCKSDLEFSENKQFLYCRNRNCISVLENKILLFFNILDVKGVGNVVAKNIAKDLSSKHLDDLDLLYRDEEYFINITGSKKNGTKIYNNLRKALNSFADYQAFALLGIPSISTVMAKKILKHFKFSELVDCELSDFNNINGIGIILTNELFNGFRDEFILNRFKRLLPFVKEKSLDKNITSSNLEGKKFCITGSLPIKRKELIELIEKHNGQYTNSVSKQTNYLITGEITGSKLDSANKLGVQCITYEEFLDMISD